MQEKKIVSIIVPIYKVEQYMDECITSIVNQTYSNIEIILVDDGSPDNCPRKCDDWGKADERVVVYHKKNGGLSDARNYGIEVAKGEFIMFVDSDDYIAREMVEKLYSSIIDSDADIVGCKINTVTNGVVSEYDKIGNKNKKLTPIMTGLDYLKLFVAGEIENASWNKIYKKSCFDTIRFRKGRNNEDFLMFYELCPEIKKIAFIDYYGYFYRQREGSIVHDVNNFLYFDIIKNIEEIKADIIKNRPYLLKSIKIKELEERIVFMKLVLNRRKLCLYFSEFLQNYVKLWKSINIAKELPPIYKRPFYLLRYFPIFYSLKS